MAIITTASSKVTPTAAVTTAAPTFLARFPRSLSQLNIGSKRKSTVQSPPEPISKPLPAPITPLSPNSSSSSSSTPISSPNHQKIRVRHHHPTVTADVPPPLPQRNAPRKSLPTSPTSTPQISDLDASMMSAATASSFAVASGGVVKKKNKPKIKAYSDPKMSSEIMLQMECANYPPPLPPRTGIFDDGSVFGQIVTNKDIMDGSGIDGRALPNSVATQLNYPVIATSVTVRDGVPNFHHHHHHSYEGAMTTSSCSLPEAAPTVSDDRNLSILTIRVILLFILKTFKLTSLQINFAVLFNLFSSNIH